MTCLSLKTKLSTKLSTIFHHWHLESICFVEFPHFDDDNDNDDGVDHDDNGVDDDDDDDGDDDVDDDGDKEVGGGEGRRRLSST